MKYGRGDCGQDVEDELEDVKDRVSNIIERIAGRGQVVSPLR